MTQLLLRYIPLTLLLMVFGGIVVHAPLTVFAGTLLPDIATPLKAWKEVLIVVAALLVAVDMVRAGRWRKLKKDSLVWLVTAYWALHLFALTWTTGSLQSTIAGLFIDLRYTLFATVVYLFISLHPEYRKLFVKVAIAGACVVLGFATLQLVLPKDTLSVIGYGSETIEPYLTVDKNPEYVRFNSTLRGPNSLGAYAVIVLAGVVAFGILTKQRLGDVRLKALHILLGVGSVVALWVSYSRSAVIAAFTSVAIIAGVRYRNKLSPRVWSGIVLATLIVGLFGYAIRDSSFVHNVILHDDPSTGGATTSNDEHARSLTDGFEKMLSEPLGAGIGSSGSASLLGDKPMIIENQYLMVAHEVGWLGLALFVWILIVVLTRTWQLRRDWLALAVFASGVGLGIIGLLLPVWADDTISLVWWGLAGLVLAKGETRERTTDKKQRELLSFIDGFIKGNGYGPSYREIMRALDYKSVSTVATHVNGLITRGWLVKKDNAARTLEVLMPGDSESTAPVVVSSKKPVSAEQTIRAKLDELMGQDNDLHASDIEALRKTLVLLGYDGPDAYLV